MRPSVAKARLEPKALLFFSPELSVREANTECFTLVLNQAFTLLSFSLVQGNADEMGLGELEAEFQTTPHPSSLIPHPSSFR